MADRYWVGGTASWDATAGTKWALTSGGAGGQAVPTSADDVYFTAASGAGTVTVSVAANTKSLNFTGFTGTLISSSSVSIYGGLALSATMTLTINGVFWNFVATTDNGGVGWLITTNGKAFNSGPANTFAFNGVGGKWVLQDNVTFGNASTITLSAGTLDTNSKNVTAANLGTTTASVKSLILGSSTITLTGTNTPVNCGGTNQTLSAGTSTIYVTPTVNAGNWGTLNSFVWNDVIMQNAGNAIMGPLICANFSRIGTAVKTNTLTIAGNLVCSNTFTCTGNSVINRMSVYTSIPGNEFAIVAANHVITNTDIMDISLIGQTLGSVITSDSFNRANGSLGGSNTDVASGGTPLVWSAPSGGTWNIASNQIQTNLSPTTASITIDAGVRNVAVEAKVVSVGTSGNSGWLMALAYVDSSNFVACRINQSGAIALGYMLAGTLTITTLTGITIVAGDVVSLELVGQVILARRNGTYIGLYNIAFAANEVLQGTRVGLAGTNNNSSLNQFDDFKVSNCSPATTLTGCGDGLGNSNIIFPASVDRYAVAPGNWSSTAMWSATSGGSAGASVPLPQDNVFFDSNSVAGTYTVDMPRLGANIDCTGFTRTLLVSNNPFNFYGSLTFSSGMTWTCSSVTPITIRGRSSHTITTAGLTWNDNGYGTIIAAPGGTYTLQDNWSGTSLFVSLTQGTFNSSNYSMNLASFQSTGSSTRVANFGTSVINVTYTQCWTVSGSLYTINADACTIIVAANTPSARSFVGGSVKYNIVRYTVADNNSQLSITGSNYFETLEIGSSRAVTFAVNTQNTIKNFIASGVNNGYQLFYGAQNGTTAGVYSVDSTPLRISGDITIEAKAQLNTWNPGTMAFASKTNAAATVGYTLRISATGALTLLIGSTQGSSSVLLSTVFAANAIGWVRATWNDTTNIAQFFTSPDGVIWTQLGTNISIVSTGITASADPLYIGQRTTGNDNFYGKIYRIRLYSDTSQSTLVYDANFETKTFGANTFTESSSNAATVNITGVNNQAGDGRVTINSATSGSVTFLELVGPLISNDYQTVQDIFCLIPYKYYAGANSILISGNTNVMALATPVQLYIDKRVELSVTATSVTATLPFSMVAQTGNLLLVSYISATNPGALTAPVGYTLIDTQQGTTSAYTYTWYKIASGGETSVTVAVGNTVVNTLNIVEIGGFSGSPTLDVTSKNTSAAASVSTLSTGTAVTNTSVPAYAFAFVGLSGGSGNLSSITNNFQQMRAFIQPGSSFLCAMPLSSIALISTTITWFTARVASSQMVVFIDGVAIITNHNLSMLGVGT